MKAAATIIFSFSIVVSLRAGSFTLCFYGDSQFTEVTTHTLSVIYSRLNAI